MGFLEVLRNVQIEATVVIKKDTRIEKELDL